MGLPVEPTSSPACECSCAFNLAFSLSCVCCLHNIKGNADFLSEESLPVFSPLKGRQSSFIYLLPAFIPTLTFLLLALTFDFFLALHIPLGSDFVPFLSSNSAFIFSRLLRWQLLSLHLDQSPQPHPAWRPAGLPWASLCFLADLWTLYFLSPPPDGQGMGKGSHRGSGSVCPYLWALE